VYDTVTPVLAAAEVAAAGIPPPVRRCRGAKPKYVCHTEQEAVAKRSASCIKTSMMTRTHGCGNMQRNLHLLAWSGVNNEPDCSLSCGRLKTCK